MSWAAVLLEYQWFLETILSPVGFSPSEPLLPCVFVRIYMFCSTSQRSISGWHMEFLFWGGGKGRTLSMTENPSIQVICLDSPTHVLFPSQLLHC